MKNLDLEKIDKELTQFAADRDWDQYHSVKNLAMALSVECAELVEIFQWMKEEESNRVKEDPVAMERLRDEVADVFLYLMRIVQKTDMDLEAAVMAKLKKNAEKYPVEKAKGSSKKYNQLT